jgi:hypothetical protein
MDIGGCITACAAYKGQPWVMDALENHIVADCQMLRRLYRCGLAGKGRCAFQLRFLQRGTQ